MSDDPLSSTESQRSRRDWTRVLLGSLVASLLLMTAFLVGLFFLREPVLRQIRDVSIVFLAGVAAFSAVLTVVLLVVLLWAVRRLTERVDGLLGRGGEVLERVKGTAGTVKATSDFVGERVVSPLIRLSAWTAGLGAGVRALFRTKKQPGG